MSGFRIINMAGEAPRVPARKLPAHLAQAAQNVAIRDGDLRPLNGTSVVVTPSKVGTLQSIYEWGDGVWFHWTEDVDVVRALIAGDTTERTLYTGVDYPRATDSALATTGGTDYPTNSYRLGVLQPSASPTVSVAGGSCAAADQVSVVFTFTYVNHWGEEGPPVAPTSVVDVCEGDTVTISDMVAPSGNYNITAKRVYAAVSGGAYQLVTEVGVATASAEVAWASDDLGAVMESEEWYQPPDDMIGLCALANGINAGFAGNEVMFSERWLPHAYPPGYRHTVDWPIVGIAPAGSSLVVVTQGRPYLFSGVDPASMSGTILRDEQAGLSKRSLATVGGRVMYASPDGLVAVDAAGRVEVVTLKWLRPAQWQALKPASMHGYHWEGRYVGFYDTGAVQGGFIYDQASDGLTFTDVHATAGYNLLEADALYLVVDGDIVQWDAGSALTYTWRSKEFVNPAPLSLRAAQVKAAAYPVTFKFYADGALAHTETVASARPFRLPPGRCNTAAMEVVGTAQVHEMAVAETIRELAGV